MAFPGRQKPAKAPSPSTRSPRPAGGDGAPAASLSPEQHVRLAVGLKVVETASKLGLEPQALIGKADALAKWILTGDLPA